MELRDTKIEKITINHRTIDVLNPADTSVNCISGSSVDFTVACSGVVPDSGTARLVSESGEEITVEIKKLDHQSRIQRLRDAHTLLGKISDSASKTTKLSTKQYNRYLQEIAELSKFDAPIVTKAINSTNEHPIDVRQLQQKLETEMNWLGSHETSQALYRGKLARIFTPCTYQLFFGDTWTEVGKIGITNYAVVQYQVAVRPPEYTRLPIQTFDGQNTAVTPVCVTGSHVKLKLKCENKSLKQAWVAIDDKKYPLIQEITKDEAGNTYTNWISDEKNSPLNSLSKTTTFYFHAIDEDHLKLEYPIGSKIRVTKDQKPKITASMVTLWIRPKYSRPTVVYSAFDDYALAKIITHAKVYRKKKLVEHKQFTTANFSPALTRNQLPLVRKKYPIDISQLNVKVGDEVKVTLQAVDFRGNLPGESAFTKEILLKVTDESGILSSLTPSMQQAEKRLHETFLLELGINKDEK